MQSGIQLLSQLDAFLPATRLCVIIVNALWIAVDTDYNDQDLLIYARPEFQIMETLSSK